MYEVTVDKERLLKILKENREKHHEIFLEALEGYKKVLLDSFEKKVEDLKNGKVVTRTVDIKEPVDHTNDYDRIITMIEMHVDNEITLDSSCFANYVLDDWGWSREFFIANSLYSDSARAANLR